MEANIGRSFYKHWVFWGLVLIGLSYVITYFAGAGAWDNLYTDLGGILGLVGLILSVIGFWKDPKPRPWAIAGFSVAVIVWILAFVALKLFY